MRWQELLEGTMGAVSGLSHDRIPKDVLADLLDTIKDHGVDDENLRLDSIYLYQIKLAGFPLIYYADDSNNEMDAVWDSKDKSWDLRFYGDHLRRIKLYNVIQLLVSSHERDFSFKEWWVGQTGYSQPRRLELNKLHSSPDKLTHVDPDAHKSPLERQAEEMFKKVYDNAKGAAEYIKEKGLL